MSTKRFTYILTAVLALFVTANVVFWYGYSCHAFYDVDGHGDMKRQAGLVMPESKTKPLKFPKEHTEFKAYLENPNPHDVITIGDSFSNGAGGNYYQDYLCSQYGWSVLNIPARPFTNALQIFYVLYENGYLDEIQPKVIILESLSSNMEKRFGKYPVDKPQLNRIGFEQAQWPSKAQQEISNTISKNKLIPGIMVQANFDVLKNMYHQHRKKDTYHMSKKVGKLELDGKYFSTEGYENELLFPLDSMGSYSDEHMLADMNHNFNDVAAICKEKNITLVFMPVEDKRITYTPFIVNPPADWKDNHNLDILAVMEKEYIYINTKELFQQALKKDKTVDLFWADDLHCSWKAQKLMGDELYRKLKNVL